MKTPPSISARAQALGRQSYVSRPQPSPRAEGVPSRTHGTGTFFNKAAFQKKFGSSGAQPHFRFVGGKNAHSEQPNWDSIPEQYRTNVEKMAQETHAVAQLTEPYLSFRERIAGLWKAQKREFHRISIDQGFQKMPRIDANAPFAILAMTANGTLIAMTAPDADGRRNMRYLPISDRAYLSKNGTPREVKPIDFSNRLLLQSLDIFADTPVINDYYIEGRGNWRSSNIIAIAAHADANQHVLYMTQENITRSIIDIRGKTIRPDDKPE